MFKRLTNNDIYRLGLYIVHVAIGYKAWMGFPLCFEDAVGCLLISISASCYFIALVMTSNTTKEGNDV